MQATPTTTVTILNASSVDTFSGERVGEAATAVGVPAFILERPATRPRTGAEGRAVEDPATDTPRQARVFSGRLPAGSPVVRTSRLRDELTGRVYAVRSVRQHAGLNPAADVILELSVTDPDDP